MSEAVENCTHDCSSCSANCSSRDPKSFLEAPNFIHRTIFESTPGNPVIFPAKFKEELKNLPQDCGGSYLTKKYPEQVRYIPVQDSLELYDIDTKEDLEKLFLRQNNI